MSVELPVRLQSPNHLRRRHAPLAWIAIRALVGKNITQIDLDEGLRTAQSPALLAMGLGLLAVGATLAALVFAKMEGSLRSFPSVLELLSLVDCAVYARHDQIACLGVLRSSGHSALHRRQ